MELTPVERAALAYCGPRGIPLSVFLDGRVVYPGDPLWLERDAQAAVWWTRICKECGQHPDDAVGPGHEEKWNAELSGHCDSCRALNRAALVAADRDDLIPATVGARYRMWRDEEVEGGDVVVAG